MKTKQLLKAFSFMFLLALCNKASYSQVNKVTAELHNLLVENTTKDKVIQIRFLNTSKSEFETLYKKALQSSNLPAIRQAYSSENSIGSIHFSKSSEITTADVKILLDELNVSNVIFNGKKMLVSDITKFQFSKKEQSINQDRTEK